MSELYNGWTNYETWNCALWINNQRALYEHVYDYIVPSCSDIDELAGKLKDMVECGMPALESSMYEDMLVHAVSKINYREIAKSIVEE